MDLLNVLVHMKGKAVQVGDTIYRIDADGVAHDVAKADAAVLLRNREAWQVHTAREPVVAPAPEAPIPDVPAVSPPPEEPIEVPDAVETTAEPGMDGEGTGLLDDAGEDAGTKAPEWPDPSVDLGIDYLREMATAHGVKFNSRTSEEKIVKRLRDAMFEQ